MSDARWQTPTALRGRVLQPLSIENPRASSGAKPQVTLAMTPKRSLIFWQVSGELGTVVQPASTQTVFTTSGAKPQVTL